MRGWAAALLLVSCCVAIALPDDKLKALKLTPTAEIQRRVEAARPLNGAAIPKDLKRRLGATHYAGTYCLTKEPYLIEGAKALERFGFGVAKFWFDVRGLGGYSFNSEWNLPRNATLVDLAKHPYFAEVFRMPFTTFALEVTPAGKHSNQLWREDDECFVETEKQMHDLARHLLKTYRDRDVTFVLQNWEGDWMVRGSFTEFPGRDAPKRFEAMRRWLTARQQGIKRARKEVGETKARVLHALEVNKVLDSLQGVPTLTTEVLPHVDVDLVSWSAYDSMKDAVTAWHGVEIIRHFARPHSDGTKPPVFIGEIGNPENEGGKTEAQIREWWDTRLAVFLELDVPWIIHWELYCNEPKEGKRGPKRICAAEELRGFWVLRPDGSVSWSGKYLQELLQHAGGKIAAALSQPRMLYGDTTRHGRPFAKDPSVIRFGERYLMYYSIAPSTNKVLPKGWAIGIAESRDLVNWKKAGDILPEQECEKNGIVNGRVILLDGKLHLFYNTYGNGAKDALCHATSTDGLRFARNPTNPVWHPTGDWNNGRAIDVDVIEWGDKLIMYYATRDPAGKIQMLHAVAADRKSGFGRGDWKSLCDGPVLKPELSWETKCIEAPSVIRRGDTLYLFYGGGYNNDPQQIGCAVSKDGVHFERLFREPLIPNGQPGDWNASETGHPGVFVDTDGHTYLFVQGNNDKGRTWFLSCYEIGWRDGRPFVIWDSPKFPMKRLPSAR